MVKKSKSVRGTQGMLCGCLSGAVVGMVDPLVDVGVQGQTVSDCPEFHVKHWTGKPRYLSPYWPLRFWPQRAVPHHCGLNQTLSGFLRPEQAILTVRHQPKGHRPIWSSLRLPIPVSTPSQAKEGISISNGFCPQKRNVCPSPFTQ